MSSRKPKAIRNRSGLTQEECALIQPSYKEGGGIEPDLEYRRIAAHLKSAEERLIADPDRSLEIATGRRIRAAR